MLLSVATDFVLCEYSGCGRKGKKSLMDLGLVPFLEGRYTGYIRSFDVFFPNYFRDFFDRMVKNN